MREIKHVWRTDGSVGGYSLSKSCGENQNRRTPRQQTISYMDMRTHLQELWRSCGNAKPCCADWPGRVRVSRSLATLWLFRFSIFSDVAPPQLLVLVGFFGSGLNLLHRPIPSLFTRNNRLWKSSFETVFAVGPWEATSSPTPPPQKEFVGEKKQTFQIKKTLSKDTMHLCRRQIFHYIIEDLRNFLCIYCLTRKHSIQSKTAKTVVTPRGSVSVAPAICFHVNKK